MKQELEQLRIWARNRIATGAVPDWSWQKHVALIEAVDSILHDMAVLDAAAVTESDRRAADHLRLVRAAAAQALTELSLEVTDPAQYEAKVYSLKGDTRKLH